MMGSRRKKQQHVTWYWSRTSAKCFRSREPKRSGHIFEYGAANIRVNAGHPHHAAKSWVRRKKACRRDCNRPVRQTKRDRNGISTWALWGDRFLRRHRSLKPTELFSHREMHKDGACRRK